jgi:hypothetical protein
VKKIADPKFRIVASDFRNPAAAVGEFAAVQRGWREFRIAKSSCEHGDPGCQKYGRSPDCRDCIHQINFLGIHGGLK